MYMKSFKKKLAMMLAVTTLLTVIPIDGVMAEETTMTNTEEQVALEAFADLEQAEADSDIGNTESTGSTENTENVDGTESMENTENSDDAESMESTEKLDSTEQEDETEAAEEDTELEEDAEETEKEYLIQYLIVNESMVSLGSSQQIVVSIGCDKVIEKAVLQYHNQSTGEVYQQYFSEITDNAILFEILFDNIDQAGIYQLDAIIFYVEDEAYTESFTEAGIEAVFGVNEEVEVEPDAVIDDGTTEEAIDIDVVTIDENGNTTSEVTMEDAINNASASMVMSLRLDDDREVSIYNSSRTSNVVVVIDPGHDNTHAGAQANGLSEEDINLKIAMYCKEELEEYQGVTVYMTRTTDGGCPYPGTTSGECNKNRVAFAQSVGANIYISLHNNSASNTSASGAMVFYPNTNYNSWVSSVGQGVAQQIENNLVALGLYNRGIIIKDAQYDKYVDGSVADYYGVIRNSKLAGIPAIIVEHAFMTNTGDVNNYLNNDAKLKALGVADATGIASYYGLTKNITVTAGTVTVSNVNNSAGTAVMSVASVKPSSKISKVSFAVWSKSDQSDLVWYDVANNGTGTYQATLNVAKHQYNIGSYNIHAYVYDIYGNTHYIGGTGCTFSMPTPKFTVTSDSTQTTYTLTASDVVVPGGVKSFKFAVWSVSNGQDDLIWYTATQDASGNYVVNVPIANHNTAGAYNAHAYVINNNNVSICVGGTMFQVDDILPGSICIDNFNNAQGTFDVIVTGMKTTSEIRQIQIPVWSQSDQSNLYWYVAERQSDGSYVAHVDIANHKYVYGKYTIHVYAISGNGIRKCIGGTTTTFSVPRPTMTVTADAKETNYTIDVTQIRMAETTQKVRIAVWSVAGGQDDIKWYDAVATGLGAWRANVPILNHKTAGQYNAHVYVTGTSGTVTCVGGMTFSVSDPTIQKIEITNKNEGTGTFDVVLTGLSSTSGISKVQVPVWSKSNQSDIYWYTAELQSDGTYVAHVNLARHDYNYGKYNIHVYATCGNGIDKCMGGTNITMNQPKAVLSVVGNAQETMYTATISNAGITGGIKNMYFAVWSQENGQDDLKWYTATQTSSGTWSANIPILNHKTAGVYNVHAYAQNASGQKVCLVGSTFSVTAIRGGSISTSNINEGLGRFDVIVSGISAKSGITQIQIPVWSKADQSDIHWYTAEKQSNGTYVANVSISNHNYNYGEYMVHVYVTAGNGVRQCIGGTNVTINVPTAMVTATANSNQTQYSLVASGVGMQGGVSSVRFAVWSQENGQDDLKWYNGTNTTPGTWTVNMKTSNHATAGIYYVHVYAQGKTGGFVCLGGTNFKVDGPSASSVTLVNYNETDGVFGVQVAGVTSTSGIANVQVAVWSAANQSDLLWYDATALGAGIYQIVADVRNHENNTGTYRAHVYATDNNGIRVFVGSITCSMVNVTNVLHPIMGSTAVTVQQMVDYYTSVASYPSYYAGTEAPTIEAFCRIYIEESQAEGVKAEVAFCQAMKETGFLKFGGNVSITQYNFAGIGSVAAGVAGESYSDIRTGIRAQIQHLKAYGCTDSLNQTCVDTRFRWVSRGIAPYVEWLGIQENPQGKGWATAKNYGYQIVNMVNKLKTY